MKYMTVTEVSKSFGVSTRMLRYYEKIGLLASGRKEGYAYRIYDEAAVKRLQQIIILRKLRIPLKSIDVILKDQEQVEALLVLRDKIAEVEEEMGALGTIRDILQLFAARLEESVAQKLHLDLLEDEELITLANTLAPSKFQLKEEHSMNELNKAEEVIKKLSDKEVRVIFIPSVTVAAIHTVNDMPEWTNLQQLRQFIKNSKLAELKPDFRVFGFNHDTPECHGYETWVTIPKELELPEPFTRKQFNGGLYGAHMIPFGAFEEWRWLYEWAEASNEYEIDWRAPECMMGGMLEESLNYINRYDKEPEAIEGEMQLDLLVPIRKKENA